MLEPHIATRIREYLEAEPAPRDRTLGVALMHEQSAAAAAGGLGNSRTIFRYIDAGRNELAVRAGLIWTVIRRSHASLKGVFSEGVLDDLRPSSTMAAIRARCFGLRKCRPTVDASIYEAPHFP